MNSTERVRDQVTDTPAPVRLRIHHVAVQTDDLPSSISWYEDFFGAEVSFTLSEFSELGMQRLPGLSELAELRAGELRIHLFTRGPLHGAPSPDTNHFHHLCIQVPNAEDLHAWRDRWCAIHDSGRYTFTKDVPATDIAADDDGALSFYVYDTNGVQFEFTCLAGVRSQAGGSGG